MPVDFRYETLKFEMYFVLRINERQRIRKEIIEKGKLTRRLCHERAILRNAASGQRVADNKEKGQNDNIL